MGREQQQQQGQGQEQGLGQEQEQEQEQGLGQEQEQEKGFLRDSFSPEVQPSYWGLQGTLEQVQRGRRPLVMVVAAVAVEQLHHEGARPSHRRLPGSCTPQVPCLGT